MRAPNRKLDPGWSAIALLCVILKLVVLHDSAHAINIIVDYRYDSNDFFNTQQKRDALEAAADRFSAIITTSLTAEAMADGADDPRIGFTHPGTGSSYQVSAADSSASDAIVGAGGSAASEYRGPWSIGPDEWILYAGGRNIASAGIGGTGTGTNFANLFTDNNSHLNRGFRDSSQSGNLPVWGGAIAFDTAGITWHFDLNTPATGASLDLYSIALHEIGHALGLSAGGWIDWNTHSSEGQFSGSAAITAYEQDSGTNISSLSQVSSSNHHWQDGAYDSKIFHNMSPNYVGTVGPGNPQDLLMEPTANFTGSLRRFELTNVDVGALEDIGWSAVPQIEVLNGDYNNDGVVDAADYVVWRKGTAIGTYATWRANFGEMSSDAGGGSSNASVPEPSTSSLCALIAMSLFSTCRRRGSHSLRQFG